MQPIRYITRYMAREVLFVEGECTAVDVAQKVILGVFSDTIEYYNIGKLFGEIQQYLQVLPGYIIIQPIL